MKVLVSGLLLLLVGNGYGQVGKSISSCDKSLGKPIKIHKTFPPARLYVEGGLHVQASFESAVASVIIYRSVGPSGNKALTASNRKFIYKLNGIKESDIVSMNIPEAPSLGNIYKRTRDGKFVIVDDKVKKVISISTKEFFMKAIKRGGR